MTTDIDTLAKKAKPQSWTQYGDRFEVRFSNNLEAVYFWEECSPFSKLLDVAKHLDGDVSVIIKTKRAKEVLAVIRERRGLK